jgi:hypothetical protein
VHAVGEEHDTAESTLWTLLTMLGDDSIDQLAPFQCSTSVIVALLVR